jgi:hypothetical protein
MYTYLRLLIFICALVIISNIDAHPFALDEGSIQFPKLRSATVSKIRSSQVTSNMAFSVINIVIKSIDNNTIYAKDGRFFSIPSSTQITNNHNPDIKVQIGELYFQNGNLIAIIIK